MLHWRWIELALRRHVRARLAIPGPHEYQFTTGPDQRDLLSVSCKPESHTTVRIFILCSANPLTLVLRWHEL